MSVDPPRAAPDPTAAPRRRPRWRVWLLGLIGMLAFVLPLTQVLRFQVDALLEARAELARLDPLAEVLAVQRGLIAHDEVADRVLRGRRALEEERRLRQGVVDHHLAALRAALPPNLWPQARREAEALRGDWTALVEAIRARRIDAAASHRSHRQLLDQAVQVMDLVQARQAPTGSALDAGAAGLRDASTIDERRVELLRRIAEAHRSRTLTATALVVGVVGGLLALFATLRTGSRAPAGPGPADTVRRGHGRRAGDRPAATTPAELAAAELLAVRQAIEDARSGG